METHSLLLPNKFLRFLSQLCSTSIRFSRLETVSVQLRRCKCVFRATDYEDTSSKQSSWITGFAIFHRFDYTTFTRRLKMISSSNANNDGIFVCSSCCPCLMDCRPQLYCRKINTGNKQQSIKYYGVYLFIALADGRTKSA